MMISDIEKVRTVFQGFGDRDPDLATRYIHPESYRNHNPLAHDGINGLKEFIGRLPGEKSPVDVARAFQDGPYVFTHAQGDFFGEKVFFDIFRLEDGQIVEHWDSSTELTPPNESRHSLTDGPTQSEHPEDTEKNKALIKTFYDRVIVPNEYDRMPEFCAGDQFIRHDANGGDGVAAFMGIVKAAGQKGIVFKVDEIRFVLGDGNFVLVAANGSLAAQPCVYYDLYRVENGKVAEHWGISENLLPKEKWNNQNGIL